MISFFDSVSALKSFVPILAAGCAFLPAMVNHTQVLLSASFSPSRISGAPTTTILYQKTASYSEIGALILGWIFLAIISCSLAWCRSPAQGPRCYGRLHRQPNTPPSNPAPEDDGDEDEEHPVADNNQGNPDGDGDDPQQDGGAGLDDDENGIVLQVAEAPAPEDPPPPVGGVEEDDGSDWSDLLYDGWYYWLLLWTLLQYSMGRNRKRVNIVEPAQEPSTAENTIGTRGQQVRRTRFSRRKILALLVAIPVAVFIVVLAFLLWTTFAGPGAEAPKRLYPPPPSAPPPPPPPPPIDPAHLLLVARLRRSIKARAARKRAQARRARFFKYLFILVAGPAILFFIAVVSIIWGLLWAGSTREEDSDTVNEDAEGHPALAPSAPLPPPPVQPQNPQHLLLIARLKHNVEARAARKAVRMQALSLIRQKTAARIVARENGREAEAETARERRQRVNEVQRRLWRGLCELQRERGEGATEAER